MSISPTASPTRAHPSSLNSEQQGTVIVVDNDADDRGSISQWLIDEGCPVRETSRIDEALTWLDDTAMLAILGSNLGPQQLSVFLQHASKRAPNVQHIVAVDDVHLPLDTAFRNLDIATTLSKPISPDQLRTFLAQTQFDWRLAREGHPIAQSQAEPQVGAGQSAEFLKHIELLASLDSTVLIEGESGTGKTTVARMIHDQGDRSSHPFVAVNCAALPRDLIEAELFGHERGAFTGAIKDRLGRAESADQGTLFLDEIGDLPIELQPKLLTFLQDRTVQRIGSNTTRKVDVRLIVATHQDLRQMCDQKSFRADLYYRLNVLNIHMPPLRQRTSEIPTIAESILGRIARSRSAAAVKIHEDALHALTEHTWPGNIRELENALERASAFCKDQTILPADIKIDYARRASDLQPNAQSERGFVERTLAEIERQAIIDTLDHCGGNKALTARTLGISEKSIYNKMKRLGIQR